MSENYPQLQASQAFRDLIVNLEGTENRISVSRNNYSKAVESYNVKRSKFPTSIVAGMFGFDARPYYAAEAGSDKAPKVDFGKPEN